jgi:two-component system chemotaxis response regulator CheB
VREAKDNDRLSPGLALLAPGGEKHMRVMKDSSGYYVKLVSSDKVSGHRPSVDYLFDSVADAAGKNAIGVILTGMGSDGAKGLYKMKEKGAYTIGQNKESSVVYGMPLVAYNMGAVTKQLPIDKIAGDIIERLKR